MARALEAQTDRQRQFISEEDTLLWLSRGDLKAETGSETLAGQNQALQTKYYITKILHTETDIISPCPLLANEQYTKRHTECVLNYTSTYEWKQA